MGDRRSVPRDSHSAATPPPVTLEGKSNASRKINTKSIFAWFQQNSRRAKSFPCIRPDQVHRSKQFSPHPSTSANQGALESAHRCPPPVSAVSLNYKGARPVKPSLAPPTNTLRGTQPPYSTLRHHCRYARPIRNPTPFGHNEQPSRTQGYRSGGCTSRPGAKVEVS